MCSQQHVAIAVDSFCISEIYSPVASQCLRACVTHFHGKSWHSWRKQQHHKHHCWISLFLAQGDLASLPRCCIRWWWDTWKEAVSELFKILNMGLQCSCEFLHNLSKKMTECHFCPYWIAASLQVTCKRILTSGYLGLFSNRCWSLFWKTTWSTA